MGNSDIELDLWNVFSTELEAKNAQQYDFEYMKARDYKLTTDIKATDEYYRNTTSWAEIKRRRDGNWVYPSLPSDRIYRTEKFDLDWFGVV